jgi:MerR family Zn(II)-responsive transcriptional regulator of zntA
MSNPEHLTVAALARRSGVSAGAVRFYIRKNLLRAARDPSNGYRLFSADDVARVRFVRKAQSLGFTIAEIAEIFDVADAGRSPCPQVRAIVEQRIAENRARVEALARLQDRLERATERWQSLPDLAPAGSVICHLIEASADDPCLSGLGDEA